MFPILGINIKLRWQNVQGQTMWILLAKFYKDLDTRDEEW